MEGTAAATGIRGFRPAGEDGAFHRVTDRRPAEWNRRWIGRIAAVHRAHRNRRRRRGGAWTRARRRGEVLPLVDYRLCAALGIRACCQHILDARLVPPPRRLSLLELALDRRNWAGL